eukprot:TCONS_00007752-protein
MGYILLVIFTIITLAINVTNGSPKNDKCKYFEPCSEKKECGDCGEIVMDCSASPVHPKHTCQPHHSNNLLWGGKRRRKRDLASMLRTYDVMKALQVKRQKKIDERKLEI